MLLNVDQLQKQLDKEWKFSKGGSMKAILVVNNQFQKFSGHSKFTLIMTSMTDYKSVAERTRHQRQYERRVNKRQIQTQESKIDTGKALDADLVDTESIRTDSTVQDDSSRSGNDTDADDADIRPYMQSQMLSSDSGKGEPVLPSLRNQSVVRQPNAFKSERAQMSRAQVDQESQIKMIQVKEMMQDNDLKNSKSKDKGSRSRSQSMNEQSHYKQDKTKNKAKHKRQKSYLQFQHVGLRWIPTGKLFDSCTSKVDSEPPHGLNVDIPNIHECKQTLNVSACTSINVQKEQSLDLSAEVHQAAKTVTTSNELDLLFGPLFDEYFNGENQVVLKSSAVTTTDASNKRQQQPDSTSSTSTLATTVTANGNFDL
ncbi:hypothetical protein Tco_0977003 [Tanacetum coccineum]|uniref:Uncharacterized protein n=1 Tax=Tanacetum coccineum TaxID=301880 RepID=A0ABQ5EIU7_9ASTR